MSLVECDSPVDVNTATPAIDPQLPVEVSVVMPCLNEADTAGDVHRARRSARSASTASRGEVIVADNGSTDGSQDIARRMGARVVDGHRSAATATR